MTAMQVEYKNIDPKLVVNEIRNGRSLESVQKLFCIKFKSEVQDLYLRGLMELGEIPQVAFDKKNTSKLPPSYQEPPIVRRRDKATAPAQPSTRIRPPAFELLARAVVSP
jgi:hypothetical protein